MCIRDRINYKYRIVTIDGELLHVGGSLTGGTLKNTSSLITQKHELLDNEKLLKNLIANRASLEMTINEEDSKYKNILEEKNELVSRKTNLETELRYELEKKKTLKQELEKAKEEKLKYRITRDIAFIVLGITFLVISVFISYNDSKQNNNKDNKENKTTITTTKRAKEA